MRNLRLAVKRKQEVRCMQQNGWLTILVCLWMGVMLASQAQAYLLDKDPDANFGDLWEQIEKREYQLRISMGGGAVLYLDDKCQELPIMPELILVGVPGKGNISGTSDLGNGRGAWSKIRGQLRNADNKTSIQIEGLFFGLQIMKEIVAKDDAVSIDYFVRVETPVQGTPYFDRARFMRRTEGLIFSAETQDGEKITGDLCLPFKKISNLRRLEVRTACKTIIYDFGALSDVVLDNSGLAPDHPNAAYLTIVPKNVQLDKSGTIFGYHITIKFSPAS